MMMISLLLLFIYIIYKTGKKPTKQQSHMVALTWQFWLISRVTKGLAVLQRGSRLLHIIMHLCWPLPAQSSIRRGCWQLCRHFPAQSSMSSAICPSPCTYPAADHTYSSRGTLTCLIGDGWAGAGGWAGGGRGEAALKRAVWRQVKREAVGRGRMPYWLMHSCVNAPCPYLCEAAQHK